MSLRLWTPIYPDWTLEVVTRDPRPDPAELWLVTGLSRGGLGVLLSPTSEEDDPPEPAPAEPPPPSPQEPPEPLPEWPIVVPPRPRRRFWRLAVYVDDLEPGLHTFFAAQFVAQAMEFIAVGESSAGIHAGDAAIWGRIESGRGWLGDDFE